MMEVLFLVVAIIVLFIVMVGGICAMFSLIEENQDKLAKKIAEEIAKKEKKK